MKRLFLAVLALLAATVPALAQSQTAANVIPGYWTQTGCSPGVSWCFQAYDSTHPVPVTPTSGSTVTANQGTQNAGGALAWFVRLLGADNSNVMSSTNPLNTLCQDLHNTQCDFTLPTITIQSSQYPNGSTPVSCSTGNVAAATATCTMPATAGKFTYVTGFDITGSGATVGSVVTCTLTNTGSGTHSYTFAATAGALLADTPLIKAPSPPLKATAVNTSPVLSCPSLGTGNTNMTINADGYEL